MANSSQLFKDDEQESLGHTSDDELRHVTGSKTENEANNGASSSSAEYIADRENLYNPQDSSSDSSGSSPTDLGKAESTRDPSAGGLFNTKDNKESLFQKGKAQAKSLLKHKGLLVGAGLGGFTLVAILIALVFFASLLKIPNLAQHITTYQFARLTRQFSENTTRVTEEKLAVDATDDGVFSALKERYQNIRSSTWGKLDNYRPGQVMKNLSSNNDLKFTYTTSPLGRQVLTGGTLDGVEFTMAKQGLSRYVPGLSSIVQFKNGVSFAKDFSPALSGALRANDVGPIVRGIVANRIRKQLGIGLVAWVVGSYVGKNPQQAQLQQNRDTYKAETQGTAPNEPATGPLKDAVNAGEAAEVAAVADDQLLENAIQKGGVIQSVKDAVSKALEKSGLQTAIGVVNPVYGVAMPICIIYDGSLENSGPTIDTQMAEQQRAYYYIESAADQQKYGNTTGEAVGALNQKVGDITQSNPEIRASGGTADTSASLSAETGAGGQFTLLNATPGIPSSVATTINAVAGSICPGLTNIWVGLGLGAANIAAALASLGTSEAAVETAGTATTEVAEQVGKNLAQRILIRTLSSATKVKSVLFDTAKSTGEIAGMTVLAKLIVLSRMHNVTNGLEQGAEFVNAADSGGNIAANEIDRQQLYGAPLSQAQLVRSNEANATYIAIQNKSKSAYQRYLSLGNADSLLSHMAITLSSSLSGSVTTSLLNIGSTFLNPFRYLSTLIDPFTGAAHAATDTVNYGNVQFGWSEDEEALIDSDPSYQPLANEQYLIAHTTPDEERAIATTYSKCFTDSLGSLLSSGAIRRDSQGNVDPNNGDCAPNNLGPNNNLVFRWRLAQSYNATLDQLISEQSIGS